MTRLQAEQIAADRNKGSKGGISYYVGWHMNVRDRTREWCVIRNDNGKETVI